MAFATCQQSESKTFENDFMSYDINNDGFIDASELRKKLPGLDAR